MELRQVALVLMAIFLCHSLNAREIVVGVETIPKRKWALSITPVVIPDLISAKFGLEYKLHKKLNLVIPLEAKWMDYRRAIRFFAKMIYEDKNEALKVPEKWYGENAPARLSWNLDIAHKRISSGIGVKFFPFSESMTNGFYIKTLFMAGIERFHAYKAEGNQDSAVLTHVLTLGYTWVSGNRFFYGIEAGEEYKYHTNPIKNLPALIDGFNPLIHFNFGFTI